MRANEFLNDACPVCGQTPCNCTHVSESLRTDNPCWKGYKPVGTKKKEGKTVPNCVPKEGVTEIYNAITGALLAYDEKNKDQGVTESSAAERKIHRTQALIQDYYNRSRAASNDIKRDHYIDMARQLEYELEGMIHDFRDAERDSNMVAQHDDEPSDTWNRGGLAEGFDDVVKGVKRYVKGKPSKSERETHHANKTIGAAQAFHQTSDPAEKDYIKQQMFKNANRYYKVKNLEEGDTVYPGAEVIKTKRGKPVGEIYQDASGWGCHHYDADLGADCIESREEAIEWLKDLHDEHRQDKGLREGNFTKTPSGDHVNMHTGVRSSTAPAQKKVRGYKWEVHFDYGPHMSDSVVVTATSENEARAKAEKAAQKAGRSIMINWAKPVEQGVEEDWQKTNKQDKTDGMSPKAVKAYRREHPGSKLQTAVTKKPSELKPGSKDAARRKSFCARMSGNPGPMKDEKGRPTPKAKALKRWNC